MTQRDDVVGQVRRGHRSRVDALAFRYALEVSPSRTNSASLHVLTANLQRPTLRGIVAGRVKCGPQAGKCVSEFPPVREVSLLPARSARFLSRPTGWLHSLDQTQSPHLHQLREEPHEPARPKRRLRRRLGP
jgi:hypothetical protein